MKMPFLFRKSKVRPAQPIFMEPDPWADPEIAKMCERELADLPFPRWADISAGKGPQPGGL
jgi:hypothetical protein